MRCPDCKGHIGYFSKQMWTMKAEKQCPHCGRHLMFKTDIKRGLLLFVPVFLVSQLLLWASDLWQYTGLASGVSAGLVIYLSGRFTLADNNRGDRSETNNP